MQFRLHGLADSKDLLQDADQPPIKPASDCISTVNYARIAGDYVNRRMSPARGWACGRPRRRAVGGPRSSRAGARLWCAAARRAGPRRSARWWRRRSGRAFVPGEARHEASSRGGRGSRLRLRLGSGSSALGSSPPSTERRRPLRDVASCHVRGSGRRALSCHACTPV